MPDVNVQYLYMHDVWCLINFIPIELNFTARGSLILKGLSETNVLIHWCTTCSSWIVRFYNAKQRTTSRMPHFLIGTVLLCQVWISLSCWGNSFFCQFGKPKSLVQTKNLKAESYFYYILHDTIILLTINCNSNTFTLSWSYSVISHTLVDEHSTGWHCSVPHSMTVSTVSHQWIILKQSISIYSRVTIRRAGKVDHFILTDFYRTCYEPEISWYV